MSQETWSLIKQSKLFYVQAFRKVGSALFLSVALNLVLGVAVYYVHFSQLEKGFYATNGVTAPEMLTPMDMPNNTSAALLASDPDDYTDLKVIPQ